MSPESSSRELPSLYQQFIHLSRYSRWLSEQKRRESWVETVNRYFDFFEEHLVETCDYKMPDILRKRLCSAILELKVMPSMRCLMTAGKALKAENIAGYNCSALTVSSPKAFDTLLYILMTGCGVGYTVERQYINKLPEIAEEFTESSSTIVVADSRAGWAKALRELISLLYAGQIPKWDVSQVRPAGAPLKTFGGRANGPSKLIEVFQYAVRLFKNAAGRKLNSLECHDLCCKIAEIVVVGSIRRCRPSSTRVFAQRGVIQIKDLAVGEKILSEYGKFKRVLAKERVGIRKLVAIDTQLGKFYSTPEHRWAIISNLDDGGKFIFKEAINLTADDMLWFSPYEIPGEDTTIPSFKYERPKHSTTCKDINVSSLNTVEWAWLIGFLHANGSIPDCKGVRKNRPSHKRKGKLEVVFAVADDMPNTVKKIRNFGSRIGISASMVRGRGGKERCLKLRMKSKQMALYLSQFKQSFASIDIPEFVLRGRPETRISYLAGIFDGDGSAKTHREGRKPFVAVSTVYPKFAEQVRDVYASLGYPARIQVLPKQWQTGYSVHLVGSAFKDEMANSFLPYSEKIINDYNFEHITKGHAHTFSIKPSLMKTSSRRRQFDHTYSYSMCCSFEKFRIGDEDFIPIKIKSVMEAHEDEVYDIQIEGTETFVAEGLLNHNSACLSLSNLSDDRMRAAKSGNWWEAHPERALANNSVAYTEKPEMGTFMTEWKALYESKSGERGIFNRVAAQKQASRWERRKPDADYLVNPCCVSGDTVIDTTLGRKTIEELSLLDIGSYGVRVNVNGTVHQIYEIPTFCGKTRLDADLIKLTLSNGAVLKLTPDHLIWSCQRGYVRADEIVVECIDKTPLTGSDWLLYLNGDGHSYTPNVVERSVVPNEDTYDITVPYKKCFFANGVLVHNSEIILLPNELCVGGGTPLLTKQGIFNIGDLKNKSVEIWNGEQWSKVSVRRTRKSSKLVRVKFSDGSFLDCTPDHRFSVKNRFQKTFSEVQAKDLMSFSKYAVQVEPSSMIGKPGEVINNAYEIGFAVGDGHVNQGKVIIPLYGDKCKCPLAGYRGKPRKQKGYNIPMTRLSSKVDPKFMKMKYDLDSFSQIYSWDRDSILNFFAGLADSDGSVAAAGIRIYISGEERARLAQLILTSVGVQSSVNLAARAGQITNFGIRKKDLWYLQIPYCSAILTHRLKPKRKKTYIAPQRIQSVEEIPGSYEVFCFNEPLKHKAVFGNVLTYQCNLTEAVVREDDTEETLMDKVEIAAILGTFQATLTNFKYVDKLWKENCIEERLLGVSLTGIMDNKLLSSNNEKLVSVLNNLRDHARKVNKKWAKTLGINEAAAITTVKPSGSVSALVNSSSGIHSRYARYYIRRVRSDNLDPLGKMMKEMGFPNEPDKMSPQHITVFSFPTKSPESSVLRDQMTAIEQLEFWLTYQKHWCEHKPSITVYVKEHEWLEVGAWVYKNFDDISGVSFLPYSDHAYIQAPYEEITKEQYEELLVKMPKEADWSLLSNYEFVDTTTSSQQASCSAGSCELV